MAYTRRIVAPRCDCGKVATVEVFGYRNEGYGPKCSTHGRPGAHGVGLFAFIAVGPRPGESEQ